MKGLLNYLLFTSLFVSFSIFGCSTSDDACDDHQSSHIRLSSHSHMDLDDYIYWNDGRKTLTFYDDENFGNNTQWKVVLDDGDIVKLYRDGERLSDSDIYENQDYIYEKLNEIADDMRDLKVDLEDMEDELADMDFDFDFDFEFDDKKFSMDINFDEDAFAESMEELGEVLSRLKVKKHSYHFDDDDWDWDDDDNNHWDSKKFKKEMKKLKHELRNMDNFKVNIDLDMNEFNESMEELSESLKDLDIDMSGLKKDMKKLKGFLKDMSSELEWDGYIDDADDDYELELNEDEMIVNGKRLPDKLHKKYLKMYEEHFGKELEDSFTVHR